MATCYFLAVAAGSALDQTTNNFSLFNLIETVTAKASPDSGNSVQLPFEIHAFWELAPDEHNLDLEMRIIFEHEGEGVFTGDPVLISSAKTRHRIRLLGLPPLPGPVSSIHVEWRKVGDDTWMREPARWPFILRIEPAEPVLNETNDNVAEPVTPAD